jgi:hypothetical protein
MSRSFTVALRICVNCRSPFGVGIWPWSGERFTRTHGLCKSCFQELDAAFQDERPARRSQPTAEAPLHLRAGI